MTRKRHLILDTIYEFNGDPERIAEELGLWRRLALTAITVALILTIALVVITCR